MKYKFGILGLGKMGSSILSGIINSNIYNKKEVLLYDINKEIKTKFINEGFSFSSNEEELFKNVKTVLIAIKPQMFNELLKFDFSNLNLVVISIAAGKTIKDLQKIFGNQKFIRVMPNTPAFIMSAATAIAKSENVDEETFDNVKKIFSSIGVVVSGETSSTSTSVGLVTSSAFVSAGMVVSCDTSLSIGTVVSISSSGGFVCVSVGAAAHAAKIKANNVDRHMIVNIFFFIITSVVNNTSLR